jgi:hypothetical protein
VALGASPELASSDLAGAYICDVNQKAGIGSWHLEGAPEPSSFRDDSVTRFAMTIADTKVGKPRYKIVEAAYDGPKRDQAIWQTANSVFHSAYVSDDGQNFVATEDQGFLRIAPHFKGGLWFYHAAFEYPGGEDTNLSVRYGRCVRQSA